MKKLVLILTLAAFTCSPLVMPSVQAAPVAHDANHNLSAKIQKKKAQLKKLKQRQHKLNHQGHKHGGKHK